MGGASGGRGGRGDAFGHLQLKSFYHWQGTSEGSRMETASVIILYCYDQLNKQFVAYIIQHVVVMMGVLQAIGVTTLRSR